MLKRTQEATTWASQRLSQATLAAVLTVCVTNFCWTVDADDEIRIASRVVDESTPSPREVFQKPRLEPWQVVPAAKGYGAIRLVNMMENEYLASLISLAEESVSSRITSTVLDASMIEAIQGHGVRLQNIAAVQMGIGMSLFSTETNVDGETKKEQHYFSVSSNQAVIDTIAPVERRAVVELLPVKQMVEMLNQTAGPIELSALQETLDQLAKLPSKNKRISLHTEPNCGGAVDSTLATVWRAVDGGVATFAVDYKAAFESNEESSAAVPPAGIMLVGESTHEPSDAPLSNDNSEAELEQAKLMKMIGYIGLGVDFPPTSQELSIRVVCTPIDGVTVDDLQSQWTRFSRAAMNDLDSEGPMGEPDADEYSVKLVKQLLRMRCIQTSDADSVAPGIMITGSVPLR